MWFLSSVSYQAALAFSSVSSVNLISASSSLFVLILSALMSQRAADRFTFSKLLLVVVNLSGVALVSNFSPSLVGSGLSLFSAFAYALYLAVFSTFSAKHGRIDMNLMFGVIGLFSLFICTPLMVLVHESGLEPQLPPPTMLQFGLVALNGLVGSVLTDYLWLYATLLTNSLISSISLTLSIPLSMLADALIRLQPPNTAQILSSIPIMLSFIGATYVTTSSEKISVRKTRKAVSVEAGDISDGQVESAYLMHNEDLPSPM
jgi:solute carrier family 35 protein F5